MSYNLTRGDLDPDMEVVVLDSSSGTAVAADLTGAAQTDLQWILPDGSTTTVELTVIDLPTGRLKRVWSPGDTDQYGVHRGRVLVTDGDGETTTYPNDGTWIYWWINPNLADFDS